MYFHGKNRVPVTEAILHCAAIPTGYFKGASPFEVFSKVNQWHTERGFKNGFGYHALIMPSGVVYKGRPYDMIGAHTLGKNSGTIGILLIESVKIERIGQFYDYFTERQYGALRIFLRQFPGLTKVSGHNDYAKRLCPGFMVNSDEWLLTKGGLLSPTYAAWETSERLYNNDYIHLLMQNGQPSRINAESFITYTGSHDHYLSLGGKYDLPVKPAKKICLEEMRQNARK
ncbi:N-acetylmuramoyl-L-alanine amidase [Pseudogemmobacter faecipullorum]|uniref:N-acetylmuramoyl-L-alanine amidase n=1 Tax=Pseudogemmobacter faecipullorum TaxID=2755041 RepID=A0ABS8CLU8_9RHOB|nr:N-acetylmuramoyl-L-alanine amidase [Pseudogemmobacter faecipullorum]MCB5410306.1 N-acetylmuramoyl-L-alanine amidase [Pseudogemmobacter faecipullorum]